MNWDNTPPSRINIYDLHRVINTKKERKKVIYNHVLAQLHKKIQQYAEQERVNIFYDVPEMVQGLPLYDINKCMAYMIKELRANGFLVKYYYPRTLYVSWDMLEITEFKKHKAELTGAQVAPVSHNNNTVPVANIIKEKEENMPPVTESTQHSLSIFKPILKYDPVNIPTMNYYAYATLNQNLVSDESAKKTAFNKIPKNPAHYQERTYKDIAVERNNELKNIYKMQNSEKAVKYKAEVDDYYGGGSTVLDKLQSKNTIPFRDKINQVKKNGKYILDLS
jgi:hypothetical protein